MIKVHGRNFEEVIKALWDFYSLDMGEGATQSDFLGWVDDTLSALRSRAEYAKNSDVEIEYP